jgi:hypothetical protein
MSKIGKRWPHGQYEVTFVMDADDCESLAACLPSRDGFVTELLRLADEIRALEDARHEEPGLRIGLVVRDRRPK